jgi:hypothetical protein
MVEATELCIDEYRRNEWALQPEYVEVWSEKGTVRGTLAPVLDQYGVTFRVMHGYASATVVNEIAELSRKLKGKPYIALYVGDHDPSGRHMSDVDLPGRLAEYGGHVGTQPEDSDTADKGVGSALNNERRMLAAAERSIKKDWQQPKKLTPGNW